MVGSQDHGARTFLFLQGPSSPIFMKIAEELEGYGHRCLRINLNAGDQIFWRRGGSHAYRGRFAGWPDYISGFIARHGITDLVLLGEERPYHRAAIIEAKRQGVGVFVVEMGYLRPDWLTLERDGMSSNSHFPNDPDHILEAARLLQEPDWTQRYTQTFIADAGYDLLYNLPNVFLWFLYPHYRRHALFHPLAEYAGWIVQLLSARKKGKAAQSAIDEVIAGKAPFFVYPLQLQTDYQLRSHSPYNDQREAITEILHSFSGHAPPDAKLIVKVHPLDNGLIDWAGSIAASATMLDVADRVATITGGNLAILLSQCKGVVTVNSTVGLQALQQRKPLKILGTAVFDIRGLSDPKTLDLFWMQQANPDEMLCKAFLRLLADTIQVRGNFYSRSGSDAGAHAIAERLDTRTVNEPGGYTDPPPRIRPSKRLPKMA